MTATRTVLVVDDDRELRRGLSAVLSRKGYRTLEADDGWEARQLIDTHGPDLVILDMMMPRWGGLAVLEHFQGAAKAPRFIMMTANEGPRHREYAEKLGVVAYLPKPFSVERLLESVDRAVPPAAGPEPTQTPAAPPVATRSMRCRCPGCGSRITAPVQLLGQSRTCPGCRSTFVVKPVAGDDEGSMLVCDGGPLAGASLN
jgi:CheY-like chemotaxis protein